MFSVSSRLGLIFALNERSFPFVVDDKIKINLASVQYEFIKQKQKKKRIKTKNKLILILKYKFCNFTLY